MKLIFLTTCSFFNYVFTDRLMVQSFQFEVVYFDY